MELDQFESYIPGDIDYGPPIDNELLTLIYRKYPQYLNPITKYCRPAGTTDATFRDFNKEQIKTEDSDALRLSNIMDLIHEFMNITPYQPLHFVDTFYCKLPLVTGTGYHNRHSYFRRSFAHFCHPELYAEKPTSKGYFFNATRHENRFLVHKIKHSGYPFDFTSNSDRDSKMADFLKSFPTMMFTRNHISKRDGTLKVRPVYAVDELFLDLECMLAFPATVQARKPECCIMYGLETIRGSNIKLDSLAQGFISFATIDWSGYDQRLPWFIVRAFFFIYLPSLLIISHGYMPTSEYEDTSMNISDMFNRFFNLLNFTATWYFNMVFLSADGFAFRRQFAGVPSGMLLTQFLDSFGNLYLIIDSLLEFGCTYDDIKSLMLFIMGDDNSIFTNWTIDKLHDFISFMERYCLKRWNMHLSKTKSVITTLRSKIETLSYRCNFGKPRRDVEKLIAQLVYPEHGLKPQFMSSRAIGLAYASCAQDSTFHEFCHDVYKLYLPVADLSPAAIRNTRVWILKLLEMEETEALIPLDHFPTMSEIQHLLSYYHGPLRPEPKWNYAHFPQDPDFRPKDYVTLLDYMERNNISFPELINFTV
nr:putative RNA-dependent RNA polymerase [Rhizoctonia solani virus 717]